MKINDLCKADFILLLISTSSLGSDKSSTPKKLFSCLGDYALCSSSICKVDGDTALCKCPIYSGKNLGGTTCKVRNNTAASGTSVYSDYSPKFLTTENSKLFKPGLICTNTDNKKYTYADCFDVKCKVNKGSSDALCKCPMFTTTGSIQIQSESCNESSKLCQYLAPNSKRVVVNSAPAVFGDRVIFESLRDEGKRFNPKTMLCHP
tara:strand:- start:490 stop:1107 length:618 start_codon:yes stop_codon:yes gene_type:complete